MNIENIRAVASLIENQPHEPSYNGKQGFGMQEYFHSCGTPSCIAGWAYAMKYEGTEKLDNIEKTAIVDIIEEAADYLGLDYDFADEKVFLGEEPRYMLSSITPTMAAQFLSNLADTGVADWKAVGYKGSSIGEGEE